MVSLVGDGQLEVEVLDEAGVGKYPADHAARPLDIAGKTHEAGDCPEGVAAVGLALERATHLDAARGIDGPHARRVDHVLLGDPADVGHLLGRPFLDPLTQLVEAKGPVLYEVFVPELFLDDDVHHPQGQRAVGAGTRLDPQGGARCVRARARVDDDEVLAVVE